MARDNLYMIAVACDKYGCSPCDYLYPGETNPFFRLAIDMLCLHIQSEYESLAHDLRELERTHGTMPDGNPKPKPTVNDPSDIKKMWQNAQKRAG